MFRTIGNTWQITKLSWKVLQLDRELIFFPIMGTLGAIIVGVIAAGVFAGTGTFDRLGSGETEFNVVDLIITLVAYFGGLYMVIFFNAALVAAARERLEGGDPNVMSGIRAVRGMWLAILGWTIITGTVGLILQALQSMARDNAQGVMRIVAMILVALLQTAWAYITFFVIPVLVVERVGPISAIRRSGRLLRQSWGEQLTASFSFFLIYLLALLIVAIPVVVLIFLWPVGAIIVGVILGGIALASVAAMEGIFKAALYEWVSEGKGSEWFDQQLLSNAYALKE
ncbi:MAG: DUF6159 family protein [Chloroflexi bacterium]|nr:DUF6159 family protein [Chloroflexota bacterium]MCY3589876.1 DUF6159 family protein [Chloroflexota bacterium]MCY3685296.1 DUF6159 family protein [Chloroflexota bacterium]MDE2707251.1 DUF6159 family protein [Chloroflexota bacterium]MXX48368.1 hypothetical protein [Chloroflexota bacterium]